MQVFENSKIRRSSKIQRRPWLSEHRLSCLIQCRQTRSSGIDQSPINVEQEDLALEIRNFAQFQELLGFLHLVLNFSHFWSLIRNDVIIRDFLVKDFFLFEVILFHQLAVEKVELPFPLVSG